MRYVALVFVSTLLACGSGRDRNSFIVADGGDKPSDSGVIGPDAAGMDAGAVRDSGVQDCTGNPNGCAANELMSAACDCLGICRTGFTWNPGTRQCDPDPVRDAGPGRDAGFPPGRDAGFPPGRDAGFPPGRDAGFRDAGTPIDAGNPRDAGPGRDAGPAPRDGGVPPGPGQLDAVCTVDSDCMSSVCFDLGGMTGRRCVASCSSHDTCPAGFTCYDLEGAKMCLSASLFTSASFASNNGAMCMAGSECRSNYCSASTCLGQCSADRDCPGAPTCGYREFTMDQYIAACDGPVGAGAPGVACMATTDCASGLCANNVCLAPCRTTSDCPMNQVCQQYDYSVCILDLMVTCLLWEPNFTYGCGLAQHGAGAIGTTCTNDLACRSGECNLTTGQCTDLCRHDSDCPATHRCKPVPAGTLSTGTQYYRNICL